MAPAALCTIRTEDRSRAGRGLRVRDDSTLKQQDDMGHGVSLDFAEYLLGIELGGDHHGSASTQTGKQPAVPPMDAPLAPEQEQRDARTSPKPYGSQISRISRDPLHGTSGALGRPVPPCKLNPGWAALLEHLEILGGIRLTSLAHVR